MLLLDGFLLCSIEKTHFKAKKEDKQTIDAHGAILAYISPYFHWVLTEDVSEKKVFMPIKYSFLKLLVEYIYLGEVRVEVPNHPMSKVTNMRQLWS